MKHTWKWGCSYLSTPSEQTSCRHRISGESFLIWSTCDFNRSESSNDGEEFRKKGMGEPAKTLKHSIDSWPSGEDCRQVESGQRALAAVGLAVWLSKTEPGVKEVVSRNFWSFSIEIRLSFVAVQALGIDTISPFHLKQRAKWVSFHARYGSYHGHG